jgi:hypothetical protein
MMKEGTKAPVTGAPRESSARSRQMVDAARVQTAGTAEARLIARVFNRCQGFIRAACAASSVTEEFLGALVANESGGNPKAARFEPAVYYHLKAVAAETSPHFGGITPATLNAEVADLLHPKADAFHARYLTGAFGANHQEELATLEDEALRELATSWGFTQIMGYHMVARPGTVRELLDPERHFRIAIELLTELVEEYQLDPRREFAEMFRCWNTGRPYGETYDPHYVEHGLERMELYRQKAAGASPKMQEPQEAKGQA